MTYTNLRTRTTARRRKTQLKNHIHAFLQTTHTTTYDTNDVTQWVTLKTGWRWRGLPQRQTRAVLARVGYRVGGSKGDSLGQPPRCSGWPTHLRLLRSLTLNSPSQPSVQLSGHLGRTSRRCLHPPRHPCSLSANGSLDRQQDLRPTVILHDYELKERK